VPPDVPFDALEISYRLGIAKGREKYPELSRYAFVTSSDAHFIRDIAQACTTMFLEEPSLKEIRKALRREVGRYVGEGEC
jgi:PHP family Zn ribbon phosphoesterase